MTLRPCNVFNAFKSSNIKKSQCKNHQKTSGKRAYVQLLSLKLSLFMKIRVKHF